MNILSYSYFSGWTPGNYVSWDSTISEDGTIRQRMAPELGGTKRKQGAVILEKRLNQKEIESLVTELESFSPEIVAYFKNCPVCIDDAEDVRIKSEKYSIDLSGSFLSYKHMKENINPDYLKDVLSIWRQIDKLQPSPLSEKTKI